MSALEDLRPVKHRFIPDEFNDGATCRRCGETFEFGGLHPEERGEFDTDDPQPRLCVCGHYTHASECWGGVPAYPRPKACKCEVRT